MDGYLLAGECFEQCKLSIVVLEEAASGCATFLESNQVKTWPDHRWSQETPGNSECHIVFVFIVLLADIETFPGEKSKLSSVSFAAESGLMLLARREVDIMLPWKFWWRRCRTAQTSQTHGKACRTRDGSNDDCHEVHE